MSESLGLRKGTRATALLIVVACSCCHDPLILDDEQACAPRSRLRLSVSTSLDRLEDLAMTVVADDGVTISLGGEGAEIAIGLVGRTSDAQPPAIGEIVRAHSTLEERLYLRLESPDGALLFEGGKVSAGPGERLEFVAEPSAEACFGPDDIVLAPGVIRIHSDTGDVDLDASEEARVTIEGQPMVGVALAADAIALAADAEPRADCCGSGADAFVVRREE